MTCIVALRDGQDVYMGADSAGVGQGSMEIRRDPKVFRIGACLFGFTSSFRMGQILRFHLTLPERGRMEAYRWTVERLVPEIRSIYSEHGFMTKKDGYESGGTFLLTVDSRLFCIQDDFQVSERVEDFDSCGCGQKYAVGALEILQGFDLLPVEKVKKALRAAEKFSTGVRGPFRILSIMDAGK